MPHKYKEDRALRNWASSKQRVFHNQNSLLQDQNEPPDDIGFVWKPDVTLQAGRGLVIGSFHDCLGLPHSVLLFMLDFVCAGIGFDSETTSAVCESPKRRNSRDGKST